MTVPAGGPGDRGASAGFTSPPGGPMYLPSDGGRPSKLSAWRRGPWSVVSPARLAEIVERMAAERRPERVVPATLDAALSATGARGGRVLAPGTDAVLAAEGAPPRDPSLGAELAGREGPLGRIEVWGVADEAEAEATLRLIAAVGARAIENLSLRRENADGRARARRLGAAAGAVRAAADPREAVERVLAEARSLVGAPVALLLAAGSPAPEVAAYDGIEPQGAEVLGALVPPPVHEVLTSGAPWAGRLAVEELERRGLTHGTLVPVGQSAGLGVLAVLGDDAVTDVDDVTSLGELAGHAASALALSVLQQELRELGAVDPLTRFFNSRYFHGRLDQECQRALRAGVAVSVAIIGLDGLGALRAEGRQAAAEAAVEALSLHVADRLRAMDVGCRLGPDELAVILPEVEGLDALRVGERLRSALPSVEGVPEGMTLSVGVASFPDQAGRPETLAENARRALEWAREHGGDRTFLFHSDVADILREERGERAVDDEAVLTTVAAIATAIDARHPLTVHHSENVGRIAALIAAELGLAPDRVEDVRVAGLLHDIGKIGVADDIVVAGRPLSDAEAEELRRHPEIGERMLSGSRLAAMAPWVLHHHERVDGTGYPAGLAGDAIPLEARILAVANAFDHGTSGGPARFPAPASEVLLELEAVAGSELDPVPVAALRALVGRGADVTRPAEGGRA
jgi:diguanylate cyclase (GGDEF)-like protein